MNKLQWTLKFKRYRNSKAINFVLSVLICIQLIFSLYLFVPIVSEKAKVSTSFRWRPVTVNYGGGATEEYMNIVTVRIKPTTKYSIKKIDMMLILKIGDQVDKRREWAYAESDVFEYSFEDVGGKITDVSVEIISVETESMTSDILMLLLSVAGVLLGSIFLIGRLRMELMMPSE